VIGDFAFLDVIHLDQNQQSAGWDGFEKFDEFFMAGKSGVFLGGRVQYDQALRSQERHRADGIVKVVFADRARVQFGGVHVRRGGVCEDGIELCHPLADGVIVVAEEDVDVGVAHVECPFQVESYPIHA
jgi:hypothetical protein